MQNSWIENPNNEHIVWFPPIQMEILFFFEKTKTSIFGGISKLFELIIFGQILAVLGKFCCIGNG
jgi:hypothetical protein